MTPLGAVDARGLLCPLPIIVLQKAAADARPGTWLTLLSDDAAAANDVAAWCAMRGHELVESHPATDGRGGTAYVVRLGPTQVS
ncbi:MAG TPA: sulfurtransferase TusA family protein [Actinomycetes bacterium]